MNLPCLEPKRRQIEQGLPCPKSRFARCLSRAVRVRGETTRRAVLRKGPSINTPFRNGV
jgi:hypothetical protein